MADSTRLGRWHAGMARRLLCLGLPLTCLIGCGTPMVTPVRHGESLGLVFSSIRSEAPVKVDNLALGSGAKGGAGAGAVAGAMSGFSCGPWAFACVPAGLLVGAFAGWGGGAVVGLTGALPDYKVRQLRERLARAQQSHDLVASLRDNVSSRAAKIWNLSAQAPSHQLAIEVMGVELTSTRSEAIGLIVQVHTRLERNGGARPELVSEKTFSFASTPSPLAVWLDERGDLVEVLLGSCSQQLAAQIVAEYGRE